MKKHLLLITISFALLASYNLNGQSFTLPGDGNWYLVVSTGGRHGYIEYYYSHPTGNNPSIVKGTIQFINSNNGIIQQQQSMGYNAWNQPQLALINKGGVSEVWIRATPGISSGSFEILNSKYVKLELGSISDPDLTDNGGHLKIYDKTPDFTHNYIGNLTVMNGNVGIGSTNPDSKLTVKGNIHTQEVKVDLGGAIAPDYVFKENYDLKPLEEVEAHIQKEGHLPNIPSAKEMEKEGIHLKEMNLKLLEKIEELTLYVIELKKENELQQKEIEMLEDQASEAKVIEQELKHLKNKIEKIESSLNIKTGKL